MSTRIETLQATQLTAPLSGWRRVFADWAVVGSSTIVCHLLGAVTGVLLRMFLGPAQMGIWSALKLLLSYGNYANLGISKGAAREFNVATGHGRLGPARDGLNLAFTVNTLSSLLYAAVLVAAGVWIGATGGGPWSRAWALGFVAVGVLAVLGRYVTFHVSILRAEQQFGATSRLAVLEGVLTLLVTVTASWFWGLPGLLAGTLIVMLGSLLFVWRNAAAALRWAWNAAEIRRLIGVGGPILLAGAVSSLFRSLDKWMILGCLPDGEFQLGCYSVALLVTGQLFGLGNMLSIVTGPRFGQQYGNSGDRPAVARLAARAAELQAAAMALPAALALLLAPPLLAWLLPDYRTGLAPLEWLVPGTVALTLALPGSQVLIAVGRQRRALLAVLIAAAVAALGNYVALRGGLGLVGVAAATAAAYALYFILITGLSLWIELDVAARLRYLAMLSLALAPPLVSALLLRRWNPDALAANVAVVLLIWGAAAGVGWRRGGWAKELRLNR